MYLLRWWSIAWRHMSTSYLAYKAADDCTVGKSVATNAMGKDDKRKGSLGLSKWSMLHGSNSCYTWHQQIHETILNEASFCVC